MKTYSHCAGCGTAHTITTRDGRQLPTRSWDAYCPACRAAHEIAQGRYCRDCGSPISIGIYCDLCQIQRDIGAK